MANNPNPARVTDALWYFVEQCLAMQPGTQNGGTFADKPGYHNTRDNLINQGRTNDYSVRLAADRAGPGDKTAAFDWTFPDAQRGQYGTIVRYGERVRSAFRARDPRLRGWREVLIQADWDGNAEGFDFTSWSERTPDDSHLWHGHFSVLRQYLNDMNAMNGMLSILYGETLETWLDGRSRYGGMEGVDVELSDQVPNTGTADHQANRTVGQIFADVWKDLHTGSGDAYNDVMAALGEIRAAQSAPAPVTVDASAVAAALAGNAEFLAAIAEAVADENARRQVD